MESKVTLDELIRLVGPDLIGTRVKRIRERMGLSLRAAAERGDISKNTWLRLEQGLLPRVSTIRQVARVLGVTVRVLCAKDFIDSPVIGLQMKEDIRWYDMDNYSGGEFPLVDGPMSEDERREFAERGATPFSLITSRMDGQFFLPNLIELYETTPRRSHPGMEFCYVLGGAIEVVFENLSYQLEAGESVSFYASEVHHYAVIGDVRPARLLSIIIHFDEAKRDRPAPYGWIDRVGQSGA